MTQSFVQVGKESKIVTESLCNSTGQEFLNIASYLPRMAQTQPDRNAVIVTRSMIKDRATYDALTFAQLESLSNRYANGFTRAGIRRGMRVLVMVKPGFDFVAITFALFKMGAVPVMIDPGMGVNRMLDCIRMVDPQAFVGIPLAHAARVFRSGAFKSIKIIITVGKRWFWGGYSLHRLSKHVDDLYDIGETQSTDTAAILFTSGSTGPAKGVVYEHGMFDAQVNMIQSHYNIEPGEIDLPAFPLFVLFSTAMGMTAVIPKMDPSHPAKVKPGNIVRAILDHNVTNTFGSPAIWKKVAAYCEENEIKLPSLKRILIAGAPVPHATIEQLHLALAETADVHTPYGATESLPLSSVAGRQIVGELSERSGNGEGICVGKPLPGIELRLIRITDDPIKQWSDDLVAPEGEYGEIVALGAVVTKEYYGLPQATAMAKIIDGSRIWHRMGDIGRRDRDGRIWFCGRKAHRVITATATMYSVCCESVYNDHIDVERSALVGIGEPGRQEPVIIIQPEPTRLMTGVRMTAFRDEMMEWAQKSDLTRPITKMMFRESFPVDIRHNAKINREELAQWAARQPI